MRFETLKTYRALHAFAIVVLFPVSAYGASIDADSSWGHLNIGFKCFEKTFSNQTSKFEEQELTSWLNLLGNNVLTNSRADQRDFHGKTVCCLFKLTHDGQITGLSVRQPSGLEQIDQQALAMIQSAHIKDLPVPPNTSAFNRAIIATFSSSPIISMKLAPLR
jgi:TonB family protein